MQRIQTGAGTRNGATAMLLALLLAACSNGPDAGPPRPVMVAQPVSAGAQALAFAGEVRAREQPVLAFRVGGRILARHVEVGDRVARGQPLAELDPDDLRLQRQAAQAQLRAAESDLDLARAERDRYRALREGRLISHSEYDTRQTAFEAAQARVRQARAQLGIAQNQSGYAVLRAPAAGAIAERRAEAGQVVTAGQPVFVLAVDGEREVAISLPEQDIAAYRVGQDVQVELWARPGRRFPGRIRELAPEADPRGRTFAARVAFDAKVAGAELGQSARVFTLESGDSALAVPLPAVAQFDGQPFVWALTSPGGTLRRQTVKVSAYTDTDAVIVEGLSAEDWVVIAGASLLEDGQKVLAVDRDNRQVKLAQAK